MISHKTSTFSIILISRHLLLGTGYGISTIKNQMGEESASTRDTIKKLLGIGRLFLLLTTSVNPAIGKDGGVHTATLDEEDFSKASQGGWKEVFTDPGTADWKEKWFLDGEIGKVSTSPEGMTLSAGPEFKNESHHMVLWTKQNFVGDLKIEFDFTRLDKENRCVNILYIQATGSGKAEYHKDIAEWTHLRRIPSMRTYYANMNVYHVSYAAFGESNNTNNSYIRGRRYLPDHGKLEGTELKPDYFSESLFATGVKHHMTFI